MKKTIAAGFLALVSSLWAIALSAYVTLNLTDHWMNFRFLETAVQRGVIVPLVLAFAVLIASAVYLLVTLCRKEK